MELNSDKHKYDRYCVSKMGTSIELMAGHFGFFGAWYALVMLMKTVDYKIWLDAQVQTVAQDR